MKFGKTFLTHQIPEWSVYYMNYKHLKKRIKTIDLVVNQDELVPSEIPDLIGSILAEFFFELDRDIEKVDEFYNKQYKEYSRRLDKVIHVLGYSETTEEVDHLIKSSDELDEIISILLELRTAYRNLKWFGELNHKGFTKILKKLDKKLEYLNTLSNEHQLDGEEHFTDESKRITLPINHKDNYLTTRVNALPFANESELMNGLTLINTIMNKVGAEKLINPNSPVLKANDPNTNNDKKASYDQKIIDKYQDLIALDDSEGLAGKLSELNGYNLRFLITLLNKATQMCSYNCLDTLFATIETEVTKNSSLSLINCLFDKDDISGRNFFHIYVISLGKKQKINEMKKSQVDIERLQQQNEDYNNANHREIIPGETTDLRRLYGNNGGPDGAELPKINDDGLNYLFHKYLMRDETCKKELGKLLNMRDSYLRTPLHYAAQYGLESLSGKLIDFMNELSLNPDSTSIDDVYFWGDQERLTPLHLAIIGKHPKTTANLITHSKTTKLTCDSLLLLSVRLNSPELLKILIEDGKVNVNYTDFEHNNETALYIAAKLNLLDIVQFLLENKADPNMKESIFGWTPLFIAASEGYTDIVKALIDYGGIYDKCDDSGWLPMEHATLRGHLQLADLLMPSDPSLLQYDIKNPSKNTPRTKLGEFSPSLSPSPSISSDNSDFNKVYMNRSENISNSSISKLPEPNKNFVNEVYRQLKNLDTKLPDKTQPPRTRSRSPLNKRKIKPIKSFGHNYLAPDESLMLITLGTTDLRDNSEPIELNKISMAKSFFTELDTALSLVITCRERSPVSNNKPVQPPIVIDLPLEDHHGSATDPITFKLENGLSPQNTIITFDVVPTYQYSTVKDLDNPVPHLKKKILGRAVAIMNNAYTKVGKNLRSLNNNITVPIIEINTLDVLGSIRFEFMYVTSFQHPNMNLNKNDTYWKQLVSTRVIGHRGLGKNINDKKSLQLGENTVESFIAAASLGASYVEFDVQLTKDHVPVVYHDFTVAESGVDIPMHALTAEQFLGLNESGSKLDRLSSKNGNDFESSKFKKNYSLDDEMLHKLNRPRSMTNYQTPDLNKPREKIFEDLADHDDFYREYKDHISSRMRLTKTWKEKGFKGNARGLSIASSFVTFSELFKKLPPSVGFNIELKYPMLDEAEQESMGEIAYDLNFYVDTILKCIYDNNDQKRDIIFSSFHPDVCLLLSLKQPTIPILFLTEAGTAPMADIRASSLQNAIRFAKKWNLIGIVSAAATLVKTPRLAQVVKSSGLVCVTYGVENNSYELAKIQMKAGVDAVIADSVLAVREGLRKDQENDSQESE